MSVDWQAFGDGSMPDGEREKLIEAMESDQSLRAEWDGFQRFRTTLRDASLAEPFDETRAEVLLRSASTRVRNKGSGPWIPRLAFAAAALVVALLAYQRLTYDPMTLAVTPTAEIAETNDPVEAARWVQARTGFDAPALRFGAEARLVGVRHGKVWACYDYEANGERLHLYMSRSSSQVSRGRELALGGRTFFVGKGIGWKGPKLDWYLRGGDGAIRRRVARLGAGQTG